MRRASPRMQSIGTSFWFSLSVLARDPAGRATGSDPDLCCTRWIGAPRLHRRPSPLVRGAVANPMQMLLDRRQGLLKRGEWPERDFVHDVGGSLVRLDDEPRPPRADDAPHRAAQQVR